jgi:iron-sulfur cluster assembly accessory protein
MHGAFSRMVILTKAIEQQSRLMVTITNTKVAELDKPLQVLDNQLVSEVESSDMGSTNFEGDLTITSSCVRRIRQLASRRGGQGAEGVYLRVFVDAGGCSGFQYKFELEHDEDGELDEEEDIVLQPSGDTRVVIDKESLELLHGSTIDFVEEMIKSSFAVTANPQSEKACGCGSSFAIKKFSSSPSLD